MLGMKRVVLFLLAVLIFAGMLSSCGGRTNELKKGTIKEQGADSFWQPLTSTAREQLDDIYQQKLAATQEFAQVPATTGKTYYISSIHGNNSNSGTSPEQAWKSPEKANDSAIKSGDLVLFECGSVFRRKTNSYFFKSKNN